MDFHFELFLKNVSCLMFLNHICDSVSFTLISCCICFRGQGHDQVLLWANDTHRPQLRWKGINFIHIKSLHWWSCWRQDWHWLRKDNSCRHIFIDQYVWSLSCTIWKKKHCCYYVLIPVTWLGKGESQRFHLH